MGSSCLLMVLVMGYRRVPEPPASTIPFRDGPFAVIEVLLISSKHKSIRESLARRSQHADQLPWPRGAAGAGVFHHADRRAESRSRALRTPWIGMGDNGIPDSI